MAIEDLPNPIASNPSPNPRNNDLRTSQASNSCNRDNEDVTPSPVDSQKRPKEIILSVALNIASQPLQNTDPDVWAVLTAISDKARKRPQVDFVDWGYFVV